HLEVIVGRSEIDLLSALLRDQARGQFPADGGLTAQRQELQHVAALLPTGRYDGEDVLYEPTSDLTVRTVARLPPNYCWPPPPLPRIVGGFDPLYACESPQRGLHCQQLSARPRRLSAAAHAAGLQLGPDPGPQLRDVPLKGRAAQRAVPDAIPPGEQVFGTAQ